MVEANQEIANFWQQLNSKAIKNVESLFHKEASMIEVTKIRNAAMKKLLKQVKAAKKLLHTEQPENIQHVYCLFCEKEGQEITKSELKDFLLKYNDLRCEGFHCTDNTEHIESFHALFHFGCPHYSCCMIPYHDNCDNWNGLPTNAYNHFPANLDE